MATAASGAHRFWGGLTAFGVVLILSIARLGPPPPRPATASPSEFSAERAQLHLNAIAGQPRTLGSDTHARAGEYIVGTLRALGYQPIEQEKFGCGSFGACARVKNLLARLDGTAGGKAVLLMAHYDSVSAGPGASDDGVGVAALLEVARALRHEPRLPRPVIFLFDDGEESGLIGAATFRAEHPWMAEVGAIVNLEARGTSGPSLMFETSGESSRLAEALRSLPHPLTSSAFTSIYRLLPNDTDLSVFKPDRLPGINFAFIGDASRYHTPLDDIDHASGASLQHQGENSLAMVRFLAGTNLEESRKGDATFFDLLGIWVISWPEEWSLPMAAAAAVLLMVSVARALRRGRLSLGKLVWGWGTFLLVPSVAGLLACLMLICLRLGIDQASIFPRTWVAYPIPALLAVWSIGLAIAATAGALWRWAGAVGIWAGATTGWAALALVLSVALPSASYLFTLPVLAAGLAAIVWERLGGGEGVGLLCAVPAVVGGLLLFPLLWLSYDAVGLLASPFVSALVAALALFLAPLVRGLDNRRWLAPAIPAVVALIGTVVGAAMPLASVVHPEPMVISHHEIPESGLARWLVFRQDERLPESMRAVARFGPRRERPFEWGGRFPSFSAPANSRGATLPQLEILSREDRGEKRILSGRLISPRGASEVLVAFPPNAPLEAIFFQGKRVPPLSERVRKWFGGWRVYRCLTLPSAGVEVRMELSNSINPVAVEVVYRIPGLPPGGESLASKRPPSTVTIQDGDASFVSRRVLL